MWVHTELDLESHSQHPNNKNFLFLFNLTFLAYVSFPMNFLLKAGSQVGAGPLQRATILGLLGAKPGVRGWTPR